MKDTTQAFFSKAGVIIGKLIASAAVLLFSLYAGYFLLIFGFMLNLSVVLIYSGMLLIPCLLIPLIFAKKKWRVVKIWGCALAVFLVAVIVNVVYSSYDHSITVDTSPNINTEEYLPFQEHSKIVTLDREASLQLTGDLPIVDGAAAVFPVYSAFVNATYPDTTRLYNGVFEYNNTSNGYYFLADKMTDIFFGAYPSEDQIRVAEELGTAFVYTPIGYEAFVFFVHKDNPVDNLTTEQIKMIYSGQITSWSEVGGKDEPITAYQRNEGSGSQSMLVRFMDDTPLADAPSDMVYDLMSGIVEQVADYRSRSGSIGFSFRYYVEGIIQNPDIKLLSVDGITPTQENIKNGSYPIITPLYAVTYAGNDNENVQLLIDWILSDEGQEIIERTGYTGVG